MRIKLPDYIEKMEEGPHKKDSIRQFKRSIRKNARNKQRSNEELYL